VKNSVYADMPFDIPHELQIALMLTVEFSNMYYTR
jgi:hypothetical protein